MTPEELSLGLGGLFDKAFGSALRLAEDRSIWPPAALARADQMTVKEFLAGQGLSADAFEALGLQPFVRTSALEAITLISSGHSAKQMHKIAGGNDQLPKAFAARLADKIIYGAPVHADRTGDNGGCRDLLAERREPPDCRGQARSAPSRFPCFGASRLRRGFHRRRLASFAKWRTAPCPA